MLDLYVKQRMYQQQFEMLKCRKCSEIVPVNFNYQSCIIVSTGVIEYAGKKFVYQTHSCGCGPQPTIWGAYLEEEISWDSSEVCACFAACDKTKDRQLAGQKIIDKVYSVRLPANEQEKQEVAAALRSHFGENKEISFF